MTLKFINHHTLLKYGKMSFWEDEKAGLVLKMGLILTELRQCITNPKILPANSWLTGPTHCSFTYTRYLEGSNNLMVLNLDVIDLILLKMMSGYPFQRKISVTF